MDPVLAGTLGGVIGLTIGVLVMWASRRNAVSGDPASTPQTLVPEGVRDVLAVLRSSAVVLNVHDEVVSTSPSMPLRRFALTRRTMSRISCNEWPRLSTPRWLNITL